MSPVPIDNSVVSEAETHELEHKSNIFLARILASVWGVAILSAVGWLAWIHP